MKGNQLSKVYFSFLMALAVASCVAPAGQVATAEYNSNNPICVGALDCQAKMEAARNWVASNTGLQLVVDRDDLLETGGWGFEDLTAIRVRRAAIGSDRYWILLDVSCATGDDSCPPYEQSANNFNRAVSSASN
jgi:hypothetical protein